MRTAWKILWMGAVGLVGLAALLLLAAFAINFHDEPLSAEALALRQPPPNTVADADNLYLAMAGADAPEGQEVIGQGRTVVDDLNARVTEIAANPARMARGELVHEQHGPLRFRGKLSICAKIDQTCWRDAPIQAAGTAILIQANRVLVERYLALQGLGGYHDVAVADFMASYPLPHYGKEEHYLLLADVARRLQSGSLLARRQAFDQLLGEIGTWRHVLAGDANLLSTMVALAYLQRAELLLANAVADPRVPVEQLFPDGLLLPALWAGGEAPVARALSAEYRGSVPMWNRMRDPRFSDAQADALNASGPRWWYRLKGRAGMHFLRPNASENLDAALFRRLIQVANAPPHELRAAQEEFGSWRKAHVRMDGPASLFNPMGKMLVSITTDAYYNRYMLRSWDVVAFQRMVLLGYAIRRQRVANGAVPAFMKSHPEWATHPVDGREFLWDPDAHTLAVQELGEHRDNSTFTIPVWQSGM